MKLWRRPGLQISLMALLSAMLFVTLFRLNEWLFAAWEHTPGVNWIFLPAGFRVLLVLGMGWPGALGILLGNLWLDQHTLSGETWPEVLSIALVSGFGPWLVKWGMERQGLLEHDLNNMNSQRLLQFVLLYAAVNALAHQLIHAVFRTPNTVPWIDIWPMFIGDALGALMVLYGFRALLRWRRWSDPEA